MQFDAPLAAHGRLLVHAPPIYKTKFLENKATSTGQTLLLHVPVLSVPPSMADFAT